MSVAMLEAMSVSESERGVVCAAGVRRGAESRPFTAQQVLDHVHDHNTPVYLETDSGGYLVGSGGRGAAVLCARAPLAPHALCAALLLDVCPGGTLRLRAAAPLAPHAAPQLWLTQAALAALHMPFLAPRNIHPHHYECHQCGAAFQDPNPLKLHLFLSCAPYRRAHFWQRVCERLQSAPPLAPAELEALAAEWGGGHRCVYCGKLYSRRYGLKIHLRTHTGYRPLRCRHCLRAFADPSNLNKHVRLHAARSEPGQHARHRCSECGHTLGRRRDLLRHVRAHHPSHTHALTDIQTLVTEE